MAMDRTKAVAGQAEIAYFWRMRALSAFFLFALLPGLVRADTFVVNVGPTQNFNPSVLTIHAHDKVKFMNRGGYHNVKANDNSFRCAHGCDGDGNNGDGAPSSSIWAVTLTFDTPGTIGYYCESHGTPTTGMFGSIIVEPSTPVQLQEFRVD